MPDVMPYSDTRQHLASVMVKVCDEHEPVIITRQKADPVVLISLADYSALVETAYLLGSPANANALRLAMREAVHGNIRRFEIDDLDKI